MLLPIMNIYLKWNLYYYNWLHFHYRMPYGPSDPQLEIGYLDKPEITVSDIIQKSQNRLVKFLKSPLSKYPIEVSHINLASRAHVMKIKVYKSLKGFFFIKTLLKYCCKICNKHVPAYNIFITCNHHLFKGEVIHELVLIFTKVKWYC